MAALDQLARLGAVLSAGLIVFVIAMVVASCTREPPTDWGALSQGVKKVQGR